ncbi:hypothetical protein PspLS_06730 [Pyricularia sp. CBS 133598]|nr:hypothetical protein PspLS_06730 [Pyricularia sp. CBS 133598]
MQPYVHFSIDKTQKSYVGGRATGGRKPSKKDNSSPDDSDDGNGNDGDAGGGGQPIAEDEYNEDDEPIFHTRTKRRSSRDSMGGAPNSVLQDANTMQVSYNDYIVSVEQAVEKSSQTDGRTTDYAWSTSAHFTLDKYGYNDNIGAYSGSEMQALVHTTCDNSWMDIIVGLGPNAAARLARHHQTAQRNMQTLTPPRNLASNASLVSLYTTVTPRSRPFARAFAGKSKQEILGYDYGSVTSHQRSITQPVEHRIIPESTKIEGVQKTFVRQRQTPPPDFITLTNPSYFRKQNTVLELGHEVREMDSRLNPNFASLILSGDHHLGYGQATVRVNNQMTPAGDSFNPYQQHGLAVNPVNDTWRLLRASRLPSRVPLSGHI